MRYARRRLFLNRALSHLAWCCLASLVLAGIWQGLAPDRDRLPARLSLLGGLAVVVAGAISVRRSPSLQESALELDRRFGLKERAVTAWSLKPDMATSSVGQALLADAEHQVSSLRVADRFAWNWPRLPLALLPGALAFLGLMAWQSPLDWFRPSPKSDPGEASTLKEELDRGLEKLAEKPKTPESAPVVAGEEWKRIEQDIEKLIRAPRETREEVRDRIRDATALEERIRQQQKEQGDRLKAIEQSMKQAERLREETRSEKGEAAKSAPPSSLASGDMPKLEEQLERLSRKLRKESDKEKLQRKLREPNLDDAQRQSLEKELSQLEGQPDLTAKEREELTRQMEQMADDLKRLTRKREEKEQELKELARKGEITQEELDRELDQLSENEKALAENQEKLQELKEEIEQCEKCLKEGKDGEAAESLERAAKKAAGMGSGKQDAEMARRLAQVAQVRKLLSRSLSATGGVGQGRRPETKDDSTGQKDTLVEGERDQGKMRVTGTGPFGGFKGPRAPVEMKEEIRQAVQEAPAALDRQRLPTEARKMARDYFEKMRRDTNAEKKTPKEKP